MEPGLAVRVGRRDTAAVAELGSVFEDEDDDGPRGPDLRVTVEIPRVALGGSIRVPVPARLAHDGDLIERVVDGADGDPERVTLHLPEQLAPRTMLRLRGQGGGHTGGGAGDLLVIVELVDRDPRPDELVTVAERATLGVDDGPTTDITVWLLLALALVSGGVVLALTL